MGEKSPKLQTRPHSEEITFPTRPDGNGVVVKVMAADSRMTTPIISDNEGVRGTEGEKMSSSQDQDGMQYAQNCGYKKSRDLLAIL